MGSWSGRSSGGPEEVVLYEFVEHKASVGLSDDRDELACKRISLFVGRTLLFVLVAANCGELAPVFGAKESVGLSAVGLNRLLKPLDMTPGCMPRNGVSKSIVPKIR